MSKFNFPMFRFGCLSALVLCLLLSSTRAQQKPAQTQPEQGDEVLRISTELVQTDIMVFDKQGNFVEGLKPEQFELKVDGKPVQISFFERVTAGSASEERQLAAGRGGARPSGVADSAATVRGRTIIFFLDDLHMAADSMTRARKTLLNFIDKEMALDDQVAISSASGQIGFLQQLTNNKAVLRAAVERLTYRPMNVRDMERPPMSVYQALEIRERANQELLSFFIEQMRREYPPPIPAQLLENMIKSRATALLEQSNAATTNTLATLETLARTSSALPGRKIIFFISDGFYITSLTSNVPDKLRRITDAAARTGVVIYTMDARGLVTSMPDASVAMAGDPSATAKIANTELGEITASQEALRTLAADTGGRALLNSNSLNAGITNTLKETSNYYLLAWRPEGETKSGGKFRRIEATIKGRPDLTVRMRRGFFDTNPNLAAASKASGTTAASAPKAPEEVMRKAIGEVYPKRELPTLVTLNYVDQPNLGPVVTVMMQVRGEAISSGNTDAAQAPPTIDVVGVLFNDQGKSISSFQNRLSIADRKATDTAATNPPLFYTHHFRATPGLYQVRVATRDNKSGRVGSAMQWIEVPDLASRKLAVSSLIIGESVKEAENVKTASTALQSTMSVDRRFKRASKLRFLLYIYNAFRGADGTAPPDVMLQVQIQRDGRAVITSPLRKVEHAQVSDLARLPYAAEMLLKDLPSGRYVLQVNVIDRAAKTSAMQRADFEIE